MLCESVPQNALPKASQCPGGFTSMCETSPQCCMGMLEIWVDRVGKPHLIFSFSGDFEKASRGCTAHRKKCAFLYIFFVYSTPQFSVFFAIFFPHKFCGFFFEISKFFAFFACFCIFLKFAFLKMKISKITHFHFSIWFLGIWCHFCMLLGNFLHFRDFCTLFLRFCTFFCAFFPKFVHFFPKFVHFFGIFAYFSQVLASTFHPLKPRSKA